MKKHRRYSRFFSFLFLCCDIVFFHATLVIVSLLEFGSISVPVEYIKLDLFLILLWCFLFFAFKLNRLDRTKRLIFHLNKLVNAIIFNLFIVFTLWFFFEPDIYSKKYLLSVFFMFGICTFLWRGTWHYLIRHYRIKGYNQRKVLIVGKGEFTKSFAKQLATVPELGYNYQGRVDGSKYSEIKNAALEKDIDIVFCHLPSLEEEQVREIINFAENNLIKVKLISNFSKIENYNLSAESIGNTNVLHINRLPLDLSQNRIIKKLFDTFFCLFISTFFLSWIVPIVAIIIKLESKGPIFFKQKRHGIKNKHFWCWKFRTMYHDKEEQEFKQAMKGDIRITKFGSFLRKTSLDELPQFWNVLRGEMSIVGPRPHPIVLNEKFEFKIDRFIQRHAIKPGITGLAQVSGFRGETKLTSDMKNRVKLDLFYIRKWTVFFDLKIILSTIFIFFRKNQNAY